MTGIVNGIDADLYNPETDPLLTYHFSLSDLSGKAASKAGSSERVGLPVRIDVPLFGIVSFDTSKNDVVVKAITLARIFRLSYARYRNPGLKITLLGLVKPTQINFQRISHLMSNY